MTPFMIYVRAVMNPSKSSFSFTGPPNKSDMKFNTALYNTILNLNFSF